MKFEVIQTGTNASNGTAVMKEVVGHLGNVENPRINFNMTGDYSGYQFAFKEHTGGRMATPADWQDFLKFAGKYFKASAKE